jgi:adenylate cyclase
MEEDEVTLMVGHTATNLAAEIVPASVLAQVERIAISDPFVRAPRMQRFLRYVVDQTLAGRESELGEYAIGVAVFDRGTSFEPAIDPIVRNDARRLRFKLLDFYRQTSIDKDSIVIDIPKGGYVPSFAPADRQVSTPAPARPVMKRLAVLPFELLAAQKDDGMFYARSLCLSLTAMLTAVEGVEVVSHGYVKGCTAEEAAANFRLTHIIGGSLAQSLDTYTVIVNLIQIADGTQLWAREYSFPVAELSRVHAEITATLRGAVEMRFGPQRPRPVLTMPKAA